MKIPFNKKYQYKEIQKENTKSGRFYLSDEGDKLPSVTTILDYCKDKTYLYEWKKRVGKEVAEKIVKHSSTTGTSIHKNIEKYILEGTEPEGNLLIKKMTEQIIKKGLVKIDEVWGTEVSLTHTKLYAGTADLIGIHEGVPAIIDFKNSRKVKKKEWIEDYFAQLTAYAEAHDVLFNTNINRGVIMMVTQELEYKEYIIEGREFDNYKEVWLEKVIKYYQNN